MELDGHTLEDLARLFGMHPQENGEGTLIRQTLDDGHGTAIVALLSAGLTTRPSTV